MGEKDLKKNIEFVESNKEQLLERYKNKYVVVYEAKIAGSYDTYDNAAKEAIEKYGTNANFLVYHLVEKEPVNFVMEAVL